jgi:hypothetical protein
VKDEPASLWHRFLLDLRWLLPIVETVALAVAVAAGWREGTWGAFWAWLGPMTLGMLGMAPLIWWKYVHPWIPPRPGVRAWLGALVSALLWLAACLAATNLIFD